MFFLTIMLTYLKILHTNTNSYDMWVCMWVRACSLLYQALHTTKTSGWLLSVSDDDTMGKPIQTDYEIFQHKWQAAGINFWVHLLPSKGLKNRLGSRQCSTWIAKNCFTHSKSNFYFFCMWKKLEFVWAYPY